MSPWPVPRFDPRGPADPTDRDYTSVGPQRHHKWYKLGAVQAQGRIVEAYWRFNYFQYTWFTPYGSYMRTLFKRADWDQTKQAHLSERYVLRMLTIAFALHAVAITWSGKQGTPRTIAFVLAAGIGGFRVWEIFWAQAHYALQTEKSTLTSFTRTLLLHAIFLVETALNGTTAISLHHRITPNEVLPRLLDVVTLQNSVTDSELFSSVYSKLVAYGCLAVSLVILLVALPLIVGIVAKTWFQNSDAREVTDAITVPGRMVGTQTPVPQKRRLRVGLNTVTAAVSATATLAYLARHPKVVGAAPATATACAAAAILLATLVTAARMRWALRKPR